MGAARNWTEAENEYLRENWGTVSMPSLAKRLKRSIGAIRQRALRDLGLGAFLEYGEYITLNQLLIAATGSKFSYSYKMTSWVKERGLPIHKITRNRCTFRIVYLDEFWEWAEKNKSFLDFSKMEPLIFGEEPDWVPEQRRKDFNANTHQRKDPWTSLEDDRLKHLLKMHRYGYLELSQMLNRSAGAIQRRISDLGLMERPVPAPKSTKWTEAHTQILAEGIRNGDSYSLIGEQIGRSEKAVRGKVYQVYITEKADKVREMLGQGEWGYGAPVPTVKQGRYLNGHSVTIKQEISKLAGLLAWRRNELGYEPYWQRYMCQKWHDIKGCTAGCECCDSCIEFERIKPQHCSRCGCTFYERQSNRFCAPCRVARKKKAQRKYAVKMSRSLVG